MLTNFPLLQTNCVLYDIKHADKLITSVHKKQPRSTAFNVDLEIGSLRIKTAIYKWVAVTRPYDAWKTVSDAPRDIIKVQMEHFKNDKPYELDPENTIDGYMYGSTVVPYDKSIVSDYNSGGKCFMCLGFTPRSTVLEEYMCGPDASVAVPQKNFSASQVMFAALVDAMIELDVVMIARKVYNIRSAPKIFACLPTKMHAEYPAMTVLELPFSENVIDLTVPLLSGKRFQTTPDQEAAIDELIDSMDLMSAHEDATGEFVEAYEVGKFPNPASEHILKTIAFRALHPKEKIPNPSHEEMAVAPLPAIFGERSKQAIEAVKSKFELEIVKKPAKVEWQLKHLLPDAIATTSQPVASDASEARIMAVGSVTPAEDFALLLRNGERFVTLCTQIQNVISDLVFKQIAIQDEKVVKALWIFREEARQMGPFYYNNWIETFKASLVARKRSDFWEQVIVKEGLGLIGVSDSDMSTVTDAECEEFYKFGGGKGLVHDGADDNIDIDDLFEDM
jgi:ATP-dependent DNA helicase 2 subunit 2